MVRVVPPEESMQHLDELVSDAETVLQRLELAYQVMLLCTGDLGFAMTKTYDLNAWAAGCGEWLEVSSISNANDYQARRANIRFRRDSASKTYRQPSAPVKISSVIVGLTVVNTLRIPNPS